MGTWHGYPWAIWENVSILARLGVLVGNNRASTTIKWESSWYGREIPGHAVKEPSQDRDAVHTVDLRRLVKSEIDAEVSLGHLRF